MGLFGLGELEDDKPICRNFKEQASVALSGNEVIINEALCREQRKEKVLPVSEPKRYLEPDGEGERKDKGIWEQKETASYVKTRDEVHLRFQIPKGKVAGIMGTINLLQSKFETLEVELVAKHGSISDQDYQEKIEEAFRQLGIKLENE